jgi:hypothetical protein
MDGNNDSSVVDNERYNEAPGAEEARDPSDRASTDRLSAIARCLLGAGFFRVTPRAVRVKLARHAM